jgi:RNA polymerase sigma-70 factor (ECF subfamily)
MYVPEPEGDAAAAGSVGCDGCRSVPIAVTGGGEIKYPAMSILPPEAESGDALRAVVGRLARREEAALAELYDATAARVYGLARRIVRTAPLAEEVVSDVYFQAWQQAERYDPARGRVLGWLLTICRSRALDALRRGDAAELCADPGELLDEEPAAHADEPFELLSAFEHGSRVRNALATLDERARALIAAAFFEGLSHSEIAARTRLPLGTVKTLLRRALQSLRVELAGTLLYTETRT